MIHQVEKPSLSADSHQPSIVAGSVKSSTGSLHSHHTKKASSNIAPDKRKPLAELMLQLAKVHCIVICNRELLPLSRL